MRLRRRTDHGLDDRNDRSEPGVCTEHAWRIRDVRIALPGAYICEVCQRCGALHIDGPDATAGMFAGWPGHAGSMVGSTGHAGDDDDSELSALARRWSPHGAWPPSPGD